MEIPNRADHKYRRNFLGNRDDLKGAFMNELITKLQGIVREIEREKGRSFLLSGVMEPESNFGKLDLVLSADWIDDKLAFLRYVNSKITSTLTLVELLKFGSVVLNPKAEFVEWVANTTDAPHEEHHPHVRFGDVDIRYAELFTSQAEGGQRFYVPQ